MKASLIAIALFFISITVQAIHFWQPYPINKAITNNGSYSRIELSVYDSLLSIWKYYNTPYLMDSIDTLGSTAEIVVYRTHLNNVQGCAYGFIIYDQDLHRFAPKNLKNTDPDFPGAYALAFENSVTIRSSCCLGPGGSYGITVNLYVYDINQHKWINSLNDTHASPYEWSDLTISYGGYASSYFDDYQFNPQKSKYFYHPPLATFPGIGFLEPFSINGNQDIILCQGGGMLSNGEVTVGIYDPWVGIWKAYLSYECEFSGDESNFYLQFTANNIKIFGAFDDSLHKWKIDTLNYNVISAQSHDRVFAYIDTTSTPVVHVQTYSPNLHAWIKDSIITTNGANSLYIFKSTVRWVDNIGAPSKLGYNDTIGWGNFDTPVQLNFKVVDMFPTMGIPLIFVRSYSYGIDSAHFYFSDVGFSEYQQASAWHQFKFNGSYNIPLLDSVEVCIETVSDFGLATFCKNLSFTSCAVGGTILGSDTLICSQDSVMLTLTGSIGTIQWQSMNFGGNWTNITSNGFNNDTIILTPSSQSYYRALVINGSCPRAYSNFYFIDVVPTQLNVSVVCDTSFCRGTPVAFQVDSLPGMLKFIWTYPTGFNMNNDSTSFISGIGDGNSGNVSVYATTICGVTAITSMALILNGPDTSLNTSSTGDSFSSNESNADWYQWLSCPTMTAIPGATLDYFDPQVSGSYALALSLNGCIDTSNCHDAIVVGIREQQSFSIKTEPNPVKEKITINFINLPEGTYAIRMSNIYGKVVMEEIFKNNNTKLTKEYDVSSFSSALYFTTISSDKINKTFKFIKN